MAKYSNIKLTQKGLDMAINADKSKKLIYTHIGIGDGKLADSEDVLTLTDMKSRKIFADISDINNDSKNQVTLETIVSNKVVAQGFYAREIGIYAKLGESGAEVLYAYANAGDEADYMPSKEQPIDELKLKITLIVGNVDNVTAIVNSSIIFITLADCRREIQRHNADPLAHGDFARKKDYYTKPEVDSKLNTKANRDHGLHVPSIEQANNTRFLRNDNTWQPITPSNIGSYHKNETYTKNEIDNRDNTKVSKSGDTMTGTLGFALNKGSVIGKVANENSYWKLWGADSRPSVALDIHGNGNNAEKGYFVFRKFVNGNAVAGVTLIGEGNDAYFPYAVNANRFYANNWFRARGDCGIYFEDYGGGWHMTDDEWIRAFNGKNIYTSGKIRCDAGFEGNLRGTADNANVAQHVNNDYRNMRFHWNGQNGQPTWLWGSNDGEHIYVWNPANFNVNHAKTADNATNFDGRSLSNILGLIDTANTGAIESRLKKDGYIKFRNGLIIQWMNCIESSSPNDYRYFPIKFPTTLFYINANSNHTNSWNGPSWIREADTEKFLCGLGRDYDTDNGNGKMFILAFGI